MDIRAILAQAAEEGGAGIAGGSDVYIARASLDFHGTKLA